VGPFGLWMDPEELFERTSPLRLAGRDLRRLDDTAVMAHAGMHAALGWWPPLLLPVRDVAQIAWKGNVDWEALAGLARRWRLSAVMQLAFESARTIGLGMPPGAARVLEGTPRRAEHRALRTYTTDRWVGGRTAVATLQAIPGLRAKLAYARHLLFPDREFLAARAGRGRPTYTRRLRILLRWAGAAARRRRGLGEHH
jgi:hypothetical protein